MTLPLLLPFCCCLQPDTTHDGSICALHPKAQPEMPRICRPSIIGGLLHVSGRSELERAIPVSTGKRVTVNDVPSLAERAPTAFICCIHPAGTLQFRTLDPEEKLSSLLSGVMSNDHHLEYSAVTPRRLQLGHQDSLSWRKSDPSNVLHATTNI